MRLVITTQLCSYLFGNCYAQNYLADGCLMYSLSIPYRQECTWESRNKSLEISDFVIFFMHITTSRLPQYSLGFFCLQTGKSGSSTCSQQRRHFEATKRFKVQTCPLVHMQTHVAFFACDGCNTTAFQLQQMHNILLSILCMCSRYASTWRHPWRSGYQ